MSPDFSILAQAICRAGVPSRVPLYEHIIDEEIIDQVMGYGPYTPDLSPAEGMREWAQRQIRFYVEMGYDAIPYEVYPRFAHTHSHYTDDTALYARESRGWADEHSGPIQSYDDLENPDNWPDVEQLADYSAFDAFAEYLPPGLKVVGGLCGGPFEHAAAQMGLTNLMTRLYDDPGFVARLFDLIGERLLAAAQRLAPHPAIGAYRFGDDLGFKTQTLLSPPTLREYVFPWYTRIVQVVHQAGKPFVLHSCGQLHEVMDDIIASGVDAKHSFEDVICPITEAKARWGDRIALLGGIDIHFLSTATPAEVRDMTRRVLDACAGNGGYALGSGNSIANYIPVANYLAMVEATHAWNGQR